MPHFTFRSMLEDTRGTESDLHASRHDLLCVWIHCPVYLFCRYVWLDVNTHVQEVPVVQRWPALVRKFACKTVSTDILRKTAKFGIKIPVYV